MNKVTVVPIYDSGGNLISNIEVKDELTYLNGRITKGEKYYYKGTGIPYSRHHVVSLDDLNVDDYDVLGKTDIFYLGYSVSKKSLQNKYGIFQVKYQPFFPDFVGGCSQKEGMIVLNSEIFIRSALEVIDVETYDKENQHSYYTLNYKSARNSYIKDNGDPKKLKELLSYMIENQWNFLWDKASISDVNSEGMVTDVADLFMSDKIEHLLGTIYSTFYSLAKIDQKKYFEFLNVLNFKHDNQTSFIFNSIEFLKQHGIKTNELFVSNNKIKNYKNVVLNFLLTGKNCAYCSCDMFTKEGDLVRDHYLKTVSEQLKQM
jgi:hypothetical protein